LEGFESGRAGLADYIIRQKAMAAGCQYILTLDKKAGEEEGFLHLESGKAS